MEKSEKPKINGETYETQEEIQMRLRTKESLRARRLLALAMTNYEALQFVKNDITQKMVKSGQRK